MGERVSYNDIVLREALRFKSAVDGGYNVKFAENTYTACSPVWEVSKHGNTESAAFNAMLTDSSTGGPLIMQRATRSQITSTSPRPRTGCTSRSPTSPPGTPGRSCSTARPRTRSCGRSAIPAITRAGQFCLPGSATKPPCYSYNVPSWLQFQPLQIKSVTFGDGSTAKSWSAVSDFGGEAEVNQYCGAGARVSGERSCHPGASRRGCPGRGRAPGAISGCR